MSIKTLYEKDGTTTITSGMNVGYAMASGVTTLASGVEYTANSNGWVKGYGLCNGSNKLEIVAGALSYDFTPESAITQNTSVVWCLPVKAEDKYKVTFPTSQWGGGCVLQRQVITNTFLHMGFARVFTCVNRVLGLRPHPSLRFGRCAE